jgi:hypothetical protein
MCNNLTKSQSLLYQCINIQYTVTGDSVNYFAVDCFSYLMPFIILCTCFLLPTVVHSEGMVAQSTHDATVSSPPMPSTSTTSATDEVNEAASSGR